MVEVAIGITFLLLILLVLFEFAQIFFAYLNVLTAARTGCLFASKHPEWLREIQSNPNYDPANDPVAQEYFQVVRYELLAARLDTRKAQIMLPEASEGVGLGKPVKVRVIYDLTTFASTIRLPFFGRFGLPDHYRISAVVSMPIRGE